MMDRLLSENSVDAKQLSPLTLAFIGDTVYGDYHKATGLEALFGYLYLSGDIHRIKELFYMIKGQSDD